MFVCLSLLGTGTIVAQCLNSSNAPVLILPSAEIAQGINQYIKIVLERYNKNYPEKFPEDLQLKLINGSNLKFLPNADYRKIMSVVSYDDDLSSLIDVMKDIISKYVRTVIITKIDSDGANTIEIKAKAIDLLDYSIVVEKNIKFSTTEISVVEEKIDELAKCILCTNAVIGHVDLKKYLIERNNYPFQVGVGFGIQSGGSITLGNVPSEARIIPPHPDDLENRYTEILDPTVTDNYLIYENEVFVDLLSKKSIDFNLSFYGLINITLRTTDFASSEENNGCNLFLKRYIKPEYYGDAFIYYTIKTQDQGFFSKNSLSLPISLSYPLVYFGKNPEINRRLVLRIMGGTNILLPPTINLEAENGWDRFGSHEIHETKDLGEIKEIEWFWGFDFEGAISESFHFNAKLTFIYPDYKENFKTPMTFQFDKSSSASFNLGLSWLIKAK